LVENTAHLATPGHKTIRIVASALLAASLPYRDARDLVIRKVANFPDLPKNQKLSGTVRFASLRKARLVGALVVRGVCGCTPIFPKGMAVCPEECDKFTRPSLAIRLLYVKSSSSEENRL
jgi:hypothetical protein